ncbi:PmoA family protein [Microbacterium karelineae]|uniref:DUF6807 domain-containing protein n=1 Tax=Microbacterium karelineae TaxID=2654283 RepID=UPI0012EA2117|nr:PmoA family protein [Microbacterium karelineae]
MADFEVSEGRSALTVTAAGTEIARYVFDDDTPAFEGPKPFLHPLRTLSGAPLTGYRPWDHRWHKGLQMTLTDVSGQNFWGGNTYVRGAGYLPLDNVGRIRHERFNRLVGGPSATIDEELTWITQAGEEWLSERRTHRFHGLDATHGLWSLDLRTTLTSIAGRELVLGSPTTNGRENAGYSGMFLRLARSFAGGSVTTPDHAGLAGADADAVMGSDAPWLAFSGQHDEVDGGATILAYAGTSTGDPAIRWFVRSEPTPVLAPSPTFAETVALAPGSSLALAHRFVVIDRVCAPDEIAELASELAP